MKKKIQDLNTTYNNCRADGFIQFRKDVDKYLAQSLLESAIRGIASLKAIERKTDRKELDYAILFTFSYDVLNKLINAFLLFEKLKCSNHQCTNAFLCMKYPDLEFDWKTLETIRILRNSVNYEGKPITEETWKDYKIKYEIYISSLIKIVKEKLGETK